MWEYNEVRCDSTRKSKAKIYRIKFVNTTLRFRENRVRKFDEYI